MDVEAAIQAAHAAGQSLLDSFGRLTTSDVSSKSHRRDLVTTADIEAERILVAALRAAYPGDAIRSEEEVDERGDREWFVDPLDGTVNFVQGIPLFAVSLGLYEEGRPLLSVVHLPVLGETFHATVGEGAWIGDQRLAASATRDLADAVLATGFPYRREHLSDNNLARFNAVFTKVRGLRRMGSACIDLAWTAAGRIDGFWEVHLEPHDVAGGALLVREAGGIVTDLAGGDDWLEGRSICAGPPVLHAAMLSALG